jgi:hypothetical protein
MTQPWNGLERRGRGEIVGRRACVRAAWRDVRIESVDFDERGGAGNARAWVRLGQLAPADVLVELITPSRDRRPMWCEQSYHNGSFAYTTRVACVAGDVEDVEDAPETWAVRVTATRRWTGVLDLPPVVHGLARITSGSGPGRARAARTRCGA